MRPTLRTTSRFAVFRFIASVACAVVAARADPTAQPEKITPDLQVSLLSEDVWMHTSWSDYEGTRVPSNGLLVREEDGLVLVDTAWGVESTRALIAWVDRTLRLPITRAIVTHSHSDRMGGAAVLVQHDIPFSGHPRTIELARRQNLPAPHTLDGVSEPGAAVPFGSLVVIYPGPGHTVDNLAIWLPRERLLFGGCAVKSAGSTTLGFVGEADLAAWPDSVRRLLAVLPEDKPIVVVPGHGAPGGRDLLTHTIELLATQPR